MKRILKKLLIYTLIITFFVSCSKGAKLRDDNKKTIYTSFYPLQSVTKEIVGDKINVVNLIPTGQEVHHWEPTAKDMSNIYKGSLLLVNGLNLEMWTEKFSGAIKDLDLFEVSKGVKLLKTDHHEKENEKDEHGNEIIKPMNDEEEHNHSHGEYDPHIWLSLRNMKIISENICNKISEIDSDNATYYKENLKKFHEKLELLDNEYLEKLKNPRIKYVITSHEAFKYLFNDYDLIQIPIEGINSDSEPNMAKMKKIVEFAKKEDIKYIFFEDLNDSKIEDTLAKEIGANVSKLYTIEGRTLEQEKEDVSYLDLMKKNLDNLVEATK